NFFTEGSEREKLLEALRFFQPALDAAGGELIKDSRLKALSKQSSLILDVSAIRSNIDRIVTFRWPEGLPSYENAIDFFYRNVSPHLFLKERELQELLVLLNRQFRQTTFLDGEKNVVAYFSF